MKPYHTIYSDKSGRVETSIENTFLETGTNCLYLEIDGIRFKGASFDDFELEDPNSYSKNQLKRFTFNKVAVFQSEKFALQLCNCSLEIQIPQNVIDTEREIETLSLLDIQLHLGKPMPNGGVQKLRALFVLKIDNKQFTSKCDEFETAFKQIQKEMLPNFRFHNCFSCHYSDYSPIGNGFFGSMMCFRENKVTYLTATAKEDYLKLAGHGFIPVQETYFCFEFAPREKDIGYRGWPFD